MNKKILLSLSVIGLVTTIAIGGTMAYFSDTEISNSNTFTAGELNLDIGGSESGVIAWSIDPMAPGASESGTITLTNHGNLAADHVEADFTVNVNNANAPDEIDGGSDDVDISDSMDVTAMTYAGSDLLAQTSQSVFFNSDLETADTEGNDDGTIQLDELSGVNLDDLTSAPAADGGTENFIMTVELQSGTGNGNQGDSVNLDVLFTLNQDSNQ